MRDASQLIVRLERALQNALVKGDADTGKELHLRLLALVEERDGQDTRDKTMAQVRAHITTVAVEAAQLVRAEDFGSAATRWRYAVTYARAVGDARLTAGLLSTGGYMQLRKGNGEGALDLLDEARAIAAAEAATDLLASIELNAGQVHSDRHDLAVAREHFTAALDLAHHSGDAESEQIAINNLAYIARQSGRLAEAQTGYELALKLAREGGLTQGIRAGLVNLGFLEQLRGETDRARASYEAALQIAHAGGDREGIRMATNLLAGALLEDGEVDEAERLYIEVLRSAREVGDPFSERSAIHQLAYVAGLRGDTEAELRRTRQALALSTSIGDRRGRMLSLSFMASIYQRRGDDESARAAHGEILDLARLGADIRIQWQAMAGLGYCQLEAGEEAEGMALLQEAVRLADEFSLSASSDEEQAEIFASAADLAVDLAVSCHRLATRVSTGDAMRDGYIAVERARGRDVRRALMLHDQLEGLGVPKAQADSLSRLIGEVRALTNERRAVTSLPHETDDSSGELDRRLESARADLASKHEELREAHPTYRSVIEPDVPEPEAVMSVLAPDQAIVSFALSASAGMGFVFTGRDMATFEIRDPAATGRMARALAASAADPQNQSLPFAHELYRRLLMPPEAVFSRVGSTIRELLVVPDGDLHLIPFSLLLTDQPQDAHGRRQSDPRPEDIPRTANPREIRRWLADEIANPAFDFPNLRYLDQRFPSIRVLPSVDLAVRAARDPAPLPHYDQAACLVGDPLSRHGDVELPAADVELEAVRSSICAVSADRRTWRNADLDRYTLRRADCTKEKLLEILGANTDGVSSSFCYMHFATHGVLDELRPERSGLLLSPKGDDDPIWRAYEIVRAQLRARLVVISACNTARGRYIGGSGISGLTRSFLLAGAQSVVSALWAVPDRQTADLMSALYTGIAAGEPPARALTAAVTRLRNSANIRPCHWAAFITTG